MRNPMPSLLVAVFSAALAVGIPVPGHAGEILEIVPAAPSALQPVQVRVRTGGCDRFETPAMRGDLIVLRVIRDIQCDPPPPESDFLVTLGSLPAGEYRVSLQADGSDATRFEVAAAAPLPAHARRIYVETGVWWDPRYSGSGVIVFDDFPGHRVVMIATYDRDWQPIFYTLLLPPGASQGQLYVSNGSPLGPPPVPGAFRTDAVGTAALSSGEGKLLLQFDLWFDDAPAQSLVLERFPL